MNNIEEQKEEVLKKVKDTFGFVPNVLTELAESPSTANVYLEGMGSLSQGLLSEQERQAAIITISKLKGCNYCVAAHAVLALKAGISREDLDVLKTGRGPATENLKAVFEATILLHEKQGWLSKEDLDGLKAKGLDKSRIYEIIGLIAMKTISNYVNHINSTELDAIFASEAPKEKDCNANSCGC